MLPRSPHIEAHRNPGDRYIQRNRRFPEGREVGFGQEAPWSQISSFSLTAVGGSLSSPKSHGTGLPHECRSHALQSTPYCIPHVESQTVGGSGSPESCSHQTCVYHTTPTRRGHTHTHTHQLYAHFPHERQEPRMAWNSGCSESQLLGLQG